MTSASPPALDAVRNVSTPFGASCLNCGTPLTGPYCAECGQRDLPVDPSLGELLAEAWDAFVSVDGKFFASARLLVKRPGALTQEHLAGRRTRFVPPLRLYLICSVLFFLVSAALPERKAKQTATNGLSVGGVSVVGWSEDEASSKRVLRSHADSLHAAREARDSVTRETRRDSTRRAMLASIGRPPVGPLDSAAIAVADSVGLERDIARELGTNPGWLWRTLVERIGRNGMRVKRDKAGFGQLMKEQVPRLMFVLMPVFALLLAVAYRSRRRRYPTHLIVSLHVHAFGFAALTLVALIAALPSSLPRTALLTTVWLWILAYVPLAFRRVYGGRLRYAVARAVVLEMVYAFVGLIGFAIGGVIMIALY